MIISAIVAYTKDSNGKFIIGKDNKLPWRIPRDMQWFKECTAGSPVVMGRKTHESIGRLLPKRDNIIVTRNPNYEVEGGYVFTDLEQALEFATQKGPEVFVIGGEEIYNQVIDRVDRLYITQIETNPGYEGDTFFPSWNMTHFKKIQSESIDDPKNGKVTFNIFQRHVYNSNKPTEVDSTTSSAYNSGGNIYGF